MLLICLGISKRWYFIGFLLPPDPTVFNTHNALELVAHAFQHFSRDAALEFISIHPMETYKQTLWPSIMKPAWAPTLSP